MFAIITTVLFFIAFLLLLLVTLSVPIIKSVFLFKLSANVASKLLNAGANAKHLGYIIDNVVTNAL
ncbi:hypothetical protein H0H87_000100 [Tephrocybe sp. NHM501043]|nr:hypothetical protein H0H87_000100 [Tephrocybe sp. NHM501043]